MLQVVSKLSKVKELREKQVEDLVNSNIPFRIYANKSASSVSTLEELHKLLNLKSLEK